MIIKSVNYIPLLISFRKVEKCVFESFVIMQYLEDKYGHLGAPLMPNAAEERVHVNLLVRMHDIYISSPNCTYVARLCTYPRSHVSLACLMLHHGPQPKKSWIQKLVRQRLQKSGSSLHGSKTKCRAGPIPRWR